MKTLKLASAAAIILLLSQACGSSENQAENNDGFMEENTAANEATAALKAEKPTGTAIYTEEPFISQFPLADSALKYSSEGTLNSRLQNTMSNHARMLSENLDGKASVIQYGEGVIVTLDQGDVFATDKFTLNENAKDILRHLAFNLKQMPDTYILVAGRADSDGKSEHNDRLAYRRAAVAANYLHGCGIDEDRFFVNSFGEKYPDFRNNTGINKNKNRRVDFLILPSNALREDMAMNY